MTRRGGFTFVELVIAVFLGGIVMMAGGVIYLVNSRSFREGREKAILQQNAAWCLEAIARDARGAARATFPSGSRIVLYDEDGVKIAEWRREVLGDQARLKREAQYMAPQTCSALTFAPGNADTSTVTITLEMEDAAQNRVQLSSQVALRNHDAQGG
jgi:prepilin-type N-terminal cleavage/methylation domain-containing protein